MNYYPVSCAIDELVFSEEVKIHHGDTVNYIILFPDFSEIFLLAKIVLLSKKCRKSV